MSWLHYHCDPDWQQDGLYGYHQCRCGARRTVLLATNLMGPSRRGWPECRDRHGQDTWTSGWVRPPENGWPAEEAWYWPLHRPEDIDD
jgi:hypothetical protein